MVPIDRENRQLEHITIVPIEQLSAAPSAIRIRRAS
jgi:hypothetical protein